MAPDFQGAYTPAYAGGLVQRKLTMDGRNRTVHWSRPKTLAQGELAPLVLVFLGGGHTWPGGKPYLPAMIVGKVCRDFDATETIWIFFQPHSRPKTQ